METAVHYPRPVHRQPLFGSVRASLPVAERLPDHILALPVHPALSEADVDRVVEAIGESVSP